MSVDFYLVCHTCKKMLHVAQDGLGGWSFYSREPKCMQALGSFMESHSIDNTDHKFELLNEYRVEQLEDYEEIRW